MSDYPKDHCLSIIGRIHSPFKEKFGIPRQAGLISAKGWLEMLPPWNQPEMFDGLEDYSHIWLNFIFHQAVDAGWRSKVRPPRLGGNVKKGVFSTRSPFRPNHLGLSVVRLLNIETGTGKVCLHLEGLDLLDGTPVVDVRPYLPYADNLPDASGGFSPQAPEKALRVVFGAAALRELQGIPSAQEYKTLIENVLSLDPRPAYHAAGESPRIYGVRLQEHDVRWRVAGGQAQVLSICRCHDA